MPAPTPVGDMPTTKHPPAPPIPGNAATDTERKPAPGVAKSWPNKARDDWNDFGQQGGKWPS